jgi:hypothetical protein
MKLFCSFNYFLLSLWTSSKFNSKISLEIERRMSKNDTQINIYNEIYQVINYIDSNDWTKAKYHWHHKCLGILPQVLSKSLEYRCIGTISAFFLKIMLDFQKYKLVRAQCECGDIMAPEINRSEISLELILEFFF